MSSQLSSAEVGGVVLSLMEGGAVPLPLLPSSLFCLLPTLLLLHTLQV